MAHLETWSRVIPYPEYEISSLNRIRLYETKEILVPVDDSQVIRRPEQWSRSKKYPKYEVSNLDRVRIYLTGEILLSSNNCSIPKLKNLGSIVRARSYTYVHYNEAEKKRIEQRKAKIIESTRPNTKEEKYSAEQPYTLTISKKNQIIDISRPLSKFEKKNLIVDRAKSIFINLVGVIICSYVFYNNFYILLPISFILCIVILVLVHNIWQKIVNPIERWNK